MFNFAIMVLNLLCLIIMPNFIALTSSGIEPLLAEELISLGATDVKPKIQSVQFSANFELAQKICMETRLATRILRHLIEIFGNTKEQIYDGVLNYDWHPFFVKIKSFSVEFVGTDKSIRNTQFGALTIKDAIVDNLREDAGKRPDIDKQNPDIRIHGRLFKGRCQVYVDFSGPSLHQRGYRVEQGAAPLKEHLAAALIKRSGWDGDSPFVDLFSGSGTILLEAAAIHKKMAPGLNRSSFPFEKHPEFNATKHQQLRRDLTAQIRPANVAILGYEINKYVFDKAEANIKGAGFGDDIKLIQQDAANVQLPKGTPAGTIVTNPPYGERIGDSIELLSLFKRLGLNLKQHFVGWNLSLLTSQPLLLKLLRLQKTKEYKLKNGPIDALLTNYQLTERQCDLTGLKDNSEYFISKDGQAFAGRIDKNLKRLKKWLKREDISCYRLYDADIPEYNVAVDYYDGRIVVYEYQAPKSVNPTLAQQRLLDVLSILQEKFSLTADTFSLKVRKSQKGKTQYEKQDQSHRRFVVNEFGAKLYVNIHDYLDTGLFLDHRSVRQHFANMVDGKTVLNLFCYTGSVSVHAALRGARSVTSVDMSNTYLDWAKENFRLNKLSTKHNRFHRADCLDWLKHTDNTFDLIFLDPPSFSNSKRMARTWDVQRDHVEILSMVKRCLNPGGELIFSNNLRGFSLDEDAVKELGFSVKNITKQTLPEDFQRNQKIHHCWQLTIGE